jgi:hypothetical protein
LYILYKNSTTTQITKTINVIITPNPTRLVGLFIINPNRIVTMSKTSMSNDITIFPRVSDGSLFIEVSPFEFSLLFHYFPLTKTNIEVKYEEYSTVEWEYILHTS